MSANKQSALLKEVSAGTKLEKATTLDGASEAIARAKIETAINSGKLADTLKEVDPPKEGVSDAVKQAFVEDQKEKTKK